MPAICWRGRAPAHPNTSPGPRAVGGSQRPPEDREPGRLVHPVTLCLARDSALNSRLPEWPGETDGLAQEGDD